MDRPIPDALTDGLTGAVRSGVEGLQEAFADTLAEVKPHLRGWLHLALTPLTLAAGIVLVWLSPTTTARVGSTIFVLTALVLFGVSAIYHTGSWSPRTWALLRRCDHANIFLLIAGTYTPFTLLLLHGTAREVLLTTIWTGALLGVLFRVFWTDAPRWLYTPIYMVLGWAALFFIPAFFHGATALGLGIGIGIFTMILVGGALYTCGGLVYGLRRPNPSPQWFGFHEVFHTFTVLAFVSHYVGVSMATYSLR